MYCNPEIGIWDVNIFPEESNPAYPLTIFVFEVFSFKLREICCSVETGLFKYDVLSILSDFNKVISEDKFLLFYQLLY
jgi:hypothetical protein